MDREPESLLGYLYNFQEDSLQIKFKVNLSPKKRSARTQPDLTEDEELEGVQFTPSSLLSLQASQYDPVGLASCFLVKGKLLISSVSKNMGSSILLEISKFAIWMEFSLFSYWIIIWLPLV